MKDWTRDEAISYMLQTCIITEDGAVAEVERRIAWPGQALAYKICQLKISELRAKAENQLGAAFDIKAFHDGILKTGPLPLDVLEIKMDEWINTLKNSYLKKSLINNLTQFLEYWSGGIMPAHSMRGI